jgi:signal transduction histidine kinase
MFKGSPAAAGSATAVMSAAHETVTRPISVANQARRRGRRPLRHALAWVCKLTVLAAYVAGVYLAVAVGLGALTPWSDGWRSALRLAAVAITAAGFAAVRRHVGVAVDRHLLPSPSRYEVLTSLAGRLRAAGPLEEALPSLARLLGEGTEARQAAVWLRSGPGFVRAAVWPMSPAPLGRHTLIGPKEFGRRDDIDVFAAVRDGGEMLGALSVALPAGRSPAPPDIRLVSDLANSAGFLLRNTLLTAELAQRLRTVSQQADELQRSRRRLVVARDIARRRLVYELAGSVQGTLSATREVVATLQARVHEAAGDEEALQKITSQTRAVIAAARAETNVLITRFRSVVHGIYPPALSDHGLATAVESLAATLPRTTRIAAHGLRRYPMELESPLYFCAAVALRALAARDHAVPLRIRLADTGRDLVLTIIDKSRSGQMGDDERAVLDEMGDHAGAHGGTANATEIDGSLWLQATFPLCAPPVNHPALNGSLGIGHASEVDWSEDDGAAAVGGSGADGVAQAGSGEVKAGRVASPGSAAGNAQGLTREHGRRRSRGDGAFWAAFAVYSALATAWLALGFVIGIAANVQAVRHTVERLAHGGHPSWLANVAAGLMAGLPKSYPTGEVVLDYAFSAMNIAIAVALLWLARRDWTVRLLAVGMVGSAGAFNLQAHSAIDAVQRMAGIGIGWWHSLLLHGVGGVAYVFALLLFPTGRLNNGGRSRWAGGALAFAGLAGAVALLSESTAQYPHTISFVVFFGLLTPAVGITAQWRRYVDAATAEARQQSAVLLRALVLAFGAAVLLSAGGLLIRVAHVPGFTVDPQALAFWTFRAVFAVIPCALMLGVLRFRLWDVDRLFNRALVYGLLALLIGVLYVGLVIGADVLLGLPMRQNPLIQIAATAAAALALAPARTMLSRLADRLAYGKRPAPDHVLARLSALSQATHSGVAILPSLARIVGDGLGARSCEVRLIRPDGRLEIRSWHGGHAGTAARDTAAPDTAAPDTAAPDTVARGSDAAIRPGTALLSVPVVHRGVTVGEIRVEPPAGGLAPVQRRLLADLADGAGLVLRNARLAFELERRLAVISEQAAAISASRRRIAAAQAHERQALERNLHDGAQPHLVAIRMSLGLAEHRISSGAAADQAAPLAAILEGIAARIDGASASLSEIAQGLYPPKLMEEGLCAALQAHVTAMPGETSLEFGDGTEHARFGVDVEAAVCFACLEAMQNARKHAPDAQIRLALARDAGGLRFTVVDTGPGIDPETARGFGLQGMDDRVAAVGGTLEFRSLPGEGTTVSGWVPAEPINEGAAPSRAA